MASFVVSGPSTVEAVQPPEIALGDVVDPPRIGEPNNICLEGVNFEMKQGRQDARRAVELDHAKRNLGEGADMVRSNVKFFANFLI